MTLSSLITGTTPAATATLNGKANDEFIVDGPTEPALQNLTTGQLLQQQLDKHPDKLAIVSRWQNESLTYQSLFDKSREISKNLLQYGVRSSDRVVVLAGNTIEYIELFFAVGGIGSVFTIINPVFTPEEVLATIDFIEPKMIFIADRIGYRSNAKVLKELVAKNKGASNIVQMGTAEPVASGIVSWSQFRQGEANNGDTHVEGLLDEYWTQTDTQTPLCIQFTSGTTGPRKAAMLTHHNLLNNAYQAGYRLHITSDDVFCCSPPLFHCFGLVCGPLAAVAHGATAIIPSDVFNAEASLQACVEDGCTVINAVSAMFQAMLDFAEGQIIASKLRVRTGIIAGSALAETLLQRLNNEFGLSGLAYAFGMTELSCISFMTDPTEVSLLEDCTSVGSPLPHTSAKIVDSELKTLSQGDRGELLVSGYLMFDKYYKNELKTEEAVVKDVQGRSWLRTGDLVTLSEEGTAVIVGRVKDMIKKGGENIAPRDVEKVLEEHPNVAASAVIGIADARMGETVGAYIQRARDCPQSLTSKGVKVWLRSRLAAHKIPDHIFWLGEDAGAPQELPINASGKVLKTELSANAKELLSVA